MLITDTIKRGGLPRGWAGAIPGAACIILLIFLPGFTGLVGAVSGQGESQAVSETIALEGGRSLLRALAGGAAGGLLALGIGLLVSWILAESRSKLPVLIIMCLPAVLGESSAASAFGATTGGFAESILPLDGISAMTLWVAWRFSGPVAVAATILAGISAIGVLPEPLPVTARMSSFWRRWRILTGVSLFGGLAYALSGAGHIALNPAMDTYFLAGPAEFCWSDPGGFAGMAWAVLVWPTYIIAASAVLIFTLRLGGVAKENADRD